MEIVFMGTPEFASEILLNLIDKNYNIVAVVTSQDKPSGRGQKITQSKVKEVALKNNLPLLQPEKLKDELFIGNLKELNPDLFVVIAFRMLPEVIWKIPSQGTINLHASILPQYRGAAPINWSLINGEKTTGVTTFFINDKIDCGEIILQKQIDILENDNAEILHNKLLEIGKIAVNETINLINENKYISQPQIINDNNLKIAPKIFKEDCIVNLNKTCREIYNFVRGLSPYPCSFIKIIDNNNNEKTIKLYNITYNIEAHNTKLGSIISDNKNFIKIACLDGWIFIDEIQLTGKNKLFVKEFLLGFKNIENYYSIVI